MVLNSSLFAETGNGSNEPTRITDKSSSLIDLIYINSPERVACSGVVHVGISDHSLVYLYRKLSFDLPKRHTSMTYSSFKHFKRSVFRTDISNHNWNLLSSSKDPNELWFEWKLLIKTPQYVLSVFVTLDYSQLKKKLMHSGDIMKIKAINPNDPHAWACFKRMRNKVNGCLYTRWLSNT